MNPYHNDILLYAISAGQINIVKWIVQNHFQRNEQACVLASQFGDLDILKLLVENGYPWSTGIFIFAHDHIIAWGKECDYI